MFRDLKLKYEAKYFMAFVWAVILAADMIAVSFFIAGERNMHRYIENDYNAQIIREFMAAKEKADVSMIMLGNSRLRFATGIGYDPVELVTLPDGRKLAALQFAYNAARFDLYDAFSWFMLRAEPDILLIQNSVISNASEGGKSLFQVSAIVYDYYWKLFTRYDEHKEWVHDRVNLNIKCFDEFTSEHMAQRVEFMKKDVHSLENNPNLEMARQFLRRLQSGGTQIVVLRLQPYTSLLRDYDVPLDVVDFHGIGFYPEPQQLLPDIYKEARWETFGLEDEKAGFCDEVHMNKHGRALFTKWLTGKIAYEWTKSPHR